MERLGFLADRIRQIGDRMVRCGRRCEGIARDPDQGILPRCLILETEGRTGGRGCVVVGMNPGSGEPGDPERRFYVANGPTYGNLAEWWRARSPGLPYYQRLRHLAQELGAEGPILWTEVVKCESQPGARLPLQTFRSCARSYLRDELQAVPGDWPVIAAGGSAYRALAYLALDRVVVGVPHPTGSHGHFGKLFASRGAAGELRPEVRRAVDRAWADADGTALWLGDIESFQPHTSGGE